MIKIDDVKKLRETTGAGMADCKKALEESKGDIEGAIEFLRKKGAATSAKRAKKAASEGFIAAYSHGGRIAAMVELACETDFVARNKGFQELALEIAMQVAATDPQYISRGDVSAEVIEKEKKIELEKARSEGKPEEVAAKIVEGKIEKYFAEICLLEQPFIKNADINVSDLLNEKIASIGEKINIRRFIRYEVGKDHN